MPSAFLGVYNAVYSYAPQSDQELALHEGDLLYVLEKSSTDDWWKAKKKSSSPDEDEPVGLVPSNYIEEAKPIGKYRAIYEYSQQTEEELSFPEDAILDVYDVSDPDWALVSLNGGYGFAPANYIEKAEDVGAVLAPVGQPTASVSPGPKHVSFSAPEVKRDSPLQSPVQPHSPVVEPHPHAPVPIPPQREPVSVSSPRSTTSRSPGPQSPALPHDRSRDHHGDHSHDRKRRSAPVSYDSEDSDEDGPRIPFRPPGAARYGADTTRADSPPIPPGYQTYPVQEVDSKKKRAATLGLGVNSIILLPDKSTRPKEEWAVEHLVSYNHEGKHVFLELEKPERSLDLHAGSTDAAAELVSALGELRGARRTMELIGDLATANAGKKSNIGTVLYDFAAQGADEVSVTVGDEVVILDDTLDEWWKVRRQVNGLEGVVPSSYIERGRNKKIATKGIMESPADPRARVKSQHFHEGVSDGSPSGVPERRSSLPPQNRKSASAKSKPDNSQIRTWTDRTGSFKVEAQFLGCRDGKIHLHKVNGVKIAVPVSKMALRDIEYVESMTGMSLDDDKPLKAIQERQNQKHSPPVSQVVQTSGRRSKSPAVAPTPIAQVTKKDDYDWFDFFLNCGVDVNDCQRYALNFQRDNMDEKLLENITAENMRTLGLKEGDILRVTKRLDEKYGRKRNTVALGSEQDASSAGIFAGPDGTLKNNTSRSRPAPGKQTSDVVDPKAFAQAEQPASPAPPVAPTQAQPATSDTVSGFDDDAWAPKPLKSPQLSQLPPRAPSPLPATSQAPEPALQPPAQQPAPTGALHDLSALSLDTPPLQPMKTMAPPTSNPQPPSVLMPQPPQVPMGTGQPIPLQQTSSFMGGNAPGAPSFGQGLSMPPNMPYQNSSIGATLPQFTGRQRPAAPVIGSNASGLAIPPPPARPLSAPQNFNSGFGQSTPLTSTLTGASTPNFMNYNPGAPLGQQGLPNMLGMQATGVVPQLTGSSFNSTGYPGMQNPGQTFPSSAPSQGFQAPPLQPQHTSMTSSGFGFPQQGFSTVNSGLPPPLMPQNTGMSIQPLQPQQTGPAPSVKFGVPAQKLVPQPTGRADLSKATPENPFGF